MKTNSLKIIENPIIDKEELEYWQMYQKMTICFESDEFKQGLLIAKEVIKKYPHHITSNYTWLTSFYEELGQRENMMQAIIEGFDRGAWWSEKAIIEGFGSLKDHGHFQKVLELAKQKEMTNQAELLVRTPTDYSKEKSYPLLLVLHGRYDSNATADHYWNRVVKEKNIILALLQSSQMISNVHFSWDDEEIAQNDLSLAYSILIQKFSIDPKKIMLGGVSHGNSVILDAVFSRSLLANGIIAVIPSAPTFVSRYEETVPFDQNTLISCIIVGEKDTRYQRTIKIRDFLETKGSVTKLFSDKDLGHEYPKNFHEILIQAIEFIEDQSVH
ncbi:MAG: hypothetical protein ACXAD7_09330 [Candidatus Kariarchaeaceae archaeon]|jgi:predicted esterase